MAAAEVLIDADAIPGNVLIGGLLDVARLDYVKAPQGITGVLDGLADDSKVWLAAQLYAYHDASSACHAAGSGRRELVLVTDASVQTPIGGVMTASSSPVAGTTGESGGSIVRGGTWLGPAEK